MNIETSDIVFAAYLKVCGAKLTHIEKIGTKGIFHFQEVHEKQVGDFDLGNAKVEPGAFNNAIKSLTTAARRML